VIGFSSSLEAGCGAGSLTRRTYRTAAVLPCAQDTPGLRALGSKWARLVGNLPDVSQLLDALDV
jgi:hypothetical protein